MLEKKKIALLVDVDNVKVSKDALNEIFEKLEIMGDVVFCKFYGYNDRKHLYLADIIAKYGYETAPFMRLKKRFSQLDNRIVVDAVKLIFIKPEINAYCIVSGDGDLSSALAELRSHDKFLIDVNTPYQEINVHLFDEHLYIDGMNEGRDLYKAKAPKATKTHISVPKINVAPKPATKPAPKVEEVEEVEEYVAPEVVATPVAPVEPVKVEPKEEPKVEVAKAPVANDNDYEDDMEDVVTEEDDDDDIVPEEYDDSDAKGNDNIEDYIEEEYLEDQDADIDPLVAEKLSDITNRTSNLDFTNTDDMDEKLQLIRDIEDLLAEQYSKGEGTNSTNADTKQIFEELQELVEDMKSAL